MADSLRPLAMMNPFISGPSAMSGLDMTNNYRPLSGSERMMAGANTVLFAPAAFGKVIVGGLEASGLMPGAEALIQASQVPLKGMIASGMAFFKAAYAESALAKTGVFASSAGKDVSLFGVKVYRVWGDASSPWGCSWTTKNPLEVENYRDLAGLPDLNSGRFVSEGVIINSKNVTTRLALPLDGNVGGISEVIIPDPINQIKLEKVSGVNPEF